ncbi:hypothetical protein ALP75_200581 [Pseudomonas syringae pv. actinidiae]|nr:hypothetical protein ALP75_200581 [Pseudomonas syringae pv. actinidiae]
MCPTRSSNGSTSSAKRNSNSASCRATISASPPPSIRIDEPGLGDLLARTCASTRWPSSTRSTRISSLPPEAFCPNKRAGMTRVLLNTIKSPERKCSSKSVN